MKRTTLFFVIASVALACSIGPRRGNFLPAAAPAGVEASISLDRGMSFRGELLAVENNALVVLDEGKIVRVRFSSIRRARFARSGITIRDFDVPKATQEQLRMLSRYPQGVDSPLLSSLLKAYGQTEIVTR
jgi:hypothetical protein